MPKKIHANPLAVSTPAAVVEDRTAERDERVRAIIYRTLQEHCEEAAEARRRATEIEASATRIERAVLAGEWWKLDGFLTAADVESLCNEELADRSLYLDEDPLL